MTDKRTTVVERLRRKAHVFPATGGASIGVTADGKATTTSYITDDGLRLVNPDGPEAAALIETKDAEIQALREALTRAKTLLGDPQAWADKTAELYTWTGSAFLAGEPVDDDEDSKGRLYSFLCGLIGWLATAEDVARTVLQTDGGPK